MAASRLVRSLFLLLLVLGVGARVGEPVGEAGVLRRATAGEKIQTQEGTSHKINAIAGGGGSSANASDQLPQPTVFLAIGSAPKQSDLRDVLRRTWLKDCIQDPKCDYRFFTDRPRFKRSKCDRDLCNDDMVLTDSSLTGYINFGSRGLLQLRYAMTNFQFDHYVRIDDDGLLCYEHFYRSLQVLPQSRLIWGRFHCERAIPRMDENFLLLSRDIARFYQRGWANTSSVPALDWKKSALPFSGKNTFAANVFLVAPLIPNVHIVGESKDRFRWDERVLVDEQGQGGRAPARNLLLVDPDSSDEPPLEVSAFEFDVLAQSPLGQKRETVSENTRNGFQNVQQAQRHAHRHGTKKKDTGHDSHRGHGSPKTQQALARLHKAKQRLERKKRDIPAGGFAQHGHPSPIDESSGDDNSNVDNGGTSGGKADRPAKSRHRDGVPMHGFQRLRYEDQEYEGTYRPEQLTYVPGQDCQTWQCMKAELSFIPSPSNVPTEGVCVWASRGFEKPENAHQALCPHLCERFVWMHHMDARSIESFYSQVGTSGRWSPADLKIPNWTEDASGCGWKPGETAFGEEKDTTLPVPMYSTHTDRNIYLLEDYGHFNASSHIDRQRVVDFAHSILG